MLFKSKDRKLVKEGESYTPREPQTPYNTVFDPKKKKTKETEKDVTLFMWSVIDSFRQTGQNEAYGTEEITQADQGLQKAVEAPIGKALSGGTFSEVQLPDHQVDGSRGLERVPRKRIVFFAPGEFFPSIRLYETLPASVFCHD